MNGSIWLPRWRLSESFQWLLTYIIPTVVDTLGIPQGVGLQSGCAGGRVLDRVARPPGAPRCATYYTTPAATRTGREHPPPPPHPMTTPNLNWIANYIWGIADDVLRDVYVRGKYRDVILPMTVLRRLDRSPTKQAVLDMKAWLERIVAQKARSARLPCQAFSTPRSSPPRELRARASRQQLKCRLRGLPRRSIPRRPGHPRELRDPNQITRLSRRPGLAEKSSPRPKST